MAFSGATITVTAITSTSISLLTTNPTAGGTAPYTAQWQRSTNGSSYSNISGATSLALNDTGLIPGTTYWYQVVFTDSTSATGSFVLPEVLTYHKEHGSEGIMRKERLVSIGRISGPARRR